MSQQSRAKYRQADALRRGRHTAAMRRDAAAAMHAIASASMTQHYKQASVSVDDAAWGAHILAAYQLQYGESATFTVDEAESAELVDA